MKKKEKLTLPETTASLPLKMDDWNTTYTTVLLGRLGLFSGAFAVSFRECISKKLSSTT